MAVLKRMSGVERIQLQRSVLMIILTKHV